MHDQAPPPGDAPKPADPLPDDEESAYDLLQRGHLLMRQRHNAQAAVVLGRAARLEPGRGSILEALGRAHFNAGQHELALDVFEALLEVDPVSHYAYYATAQCLRKAGRAEESLTRLRLACALDPASALYRGALARAEAWLPADGGADEGDADADVADEGDAGPTGEG